MVLTLHRAWPVKWESVNESLAPAVDWLPDKPVCVPSACASVIGSSSLVRSAWDCSNSLCRKMVTATFLGKISWQSEWQSFLRTIYCRSLLKACASMEILTGLPRSDFLLLTLVAFRGVIFCGMHTKILVWFRWAPEIIVWCSFLSRPSDLMDELQDIQHIWKK